MLFASLEFYLFFAGVFVCWLIVPGRHRWLILLTASYLFYYSWKPWFVLVLIFCTMSTWWLTIHMAKAAHNRKHFLYLAIAVNLVPLVFYKYAAFLSNTLQTLFSLGEPIPSVSHFSVFLPIGISFYSFTAISYCIDTYRGQIEPEAHPGLFALYLSFFPKLISGPIERGANLLPQFHRSSPFDVGLFYSGIQLFCRGLFKKVVIADRMAMYVNMVYGHPQDYWGWTVILAVWLFALQIYCDFSAYTDMAIGCGRIFGLELSQNFNFPYMAKSVADFWKRWHITLTSWFMAYLYIPLGGNRVSTSKWVRNIMVVFLLSGLWHGAAWTFICWGGLHGILYLAGKTTSSARERLKEIFGIKGKVGSVIQVFVTFNLVSLAWVFFRAESVGDALCLFSHMFSRLSVPVQMMASQFSTALAFGWAIFFMVTEMLSYWDVKNDFYLSKTMPTIIKLPLYAIGLLVISLLGVSSNEFIYFHF